MRYLETVANDWFDKGYETADDARNNHVTFKKVYGIVMDALGLKGTGLNLSSSEREYVDKWSDVFGFNDEIIKLACTRTKASTTKNLFKYADAILTDWASKKVRTLADVENLDKMHYAKTSAKPKLSVLPAKPQGSSNLDKINARRKVMGLAPFTQEEYDQILLERQEQ